MMNALTRLFGGRQAAADLDSEVDKAARRLVAAAQGGGEEDEDQTESAQDGDEEEDDQATSNAQDGDEEEDDQAASNAQDGDEEEDDQAASNAQDGDEEDQAAQAGSADAERARIAAIMDSKEAKGRDALARHLAFNTTMAPTDAIAALSAAAKGSGKGALAERMSQVRQPSVGPGGGPASEDTVETMSARLAGYVNTPPSNR